MPCLLVLLALFLPRVVIVLLWLFSDYIGRSFDGPALTVIASLLGFFFMPFTLLAYAVAINERGSVSGLYLVLVIVAVIMDIASWGGGGHRYSRRRTLVRER